MSNSSALAKRTSASVSSASGSVRSASGSVRSASGSVRSASGSVRSASGSVRVQRRTVILPTFVPMDPDKNPMFLENRVYQGSSGRVYPLPFYNRIANEPVDQGWEAIFIENEYIEVMLLPQIGGRIHAARDKTNGYDLFYRQQVIKPALVGLAGPWASGGVEFNWPQHHRPATYMPVDTEIEEHEDGSITVWCSDHDPLQHLKGMHGVCLHPGRSAIELKVRAYNRTSLTQTFLWWANAATRVHEGYQSFFPPDVQYVADHARRSMSTYPLCEDRYYGVDYAGRAARGVPAGEAPRQFVPPSSGGKPPVAYSPNDLTFYANIPVPTSYMCMGSEEDFFGGYDHKLKAGVVHVANHHIAPGKKQWTWGNQEFGYAWDRNLTEPDENGEYAPYIEIMSGVYTDNQPDFSFLQPGETKTWSQYWYPIRDIGPAHHANVDASINLRLNKRTLLLGIAVSRPFPNALLRIECGGKLLKKFTSLELAPDKPLVREIRNVPQKTTAHSLKVMLIDREGREIIAFTPSKPVRKEVPPAATEPAFPEQIKSSDELYLTGVHLDQYRHATRKPQLYWREALRRDPEDSRCNTAMGIWHLKRGEFDKAEEHLRRAIKRLTFRNANPALGDAFYYLGQTLRHLGREKEAYAAFYKATWNQEWQSAGYHALAQIDCTRGEWQTALEHLDHSLRFNTDHLSARNLKAMVLRKLGRTEEAETLLNQTLALDPLDWWCRFLLDLPLQCNTQTALDLVLDLTAAGFLREAAKILRSIPADPGTAPLVSYYLAWVEQKAGNDKLAQKARLQAANASPDYCFPARLEEIAILKAAMEANTADARAPYYLGNLYYDRQRQPEALRLWQRSTQMDPTNAVAWRNLGIGYQNIEGNSKKARAAYEKALGVNPLDSRLLFERDQLYKRTGESAAKRLRALERNGCLVGERDDLSVEICALYTQTGAPEKAMEILQRRRFQPWEGGEGQALGQYVRAELMLGQRALRAGDPAKAKEHFLKGLTPPNNLSETKHPLANQSDLHYWIGMALDQSGDRPGARSWWKLAAEFRGDFQEMSVRAFSEMTYYSALAMKELGKGAAAQKLLKALLGYALELEKSQEKIDYFATSLPTMLLFEDDLQARQVNTARFLQAQAHWGLGNRAQARKLLKKVLQADPNHGPACDLIGQLR